MTEEDYISFEIAILLKKKNFNIPCEFQYINCASGVPFLIDKKDESGCYYKNSEIGDDEYSAPTLQQAMKWLRKVHGIIPIILTGDSNQNPLYYWFRIDKFIDGKLNYAIYREGELEFKTYEEACEASIKYCLTNLI